MKKYILQKNKNKKCPKKITSCRFKLMIGIRKLLTWAPDTNTGL